MALWMRMWLWRQGCLPTGRCRGAGAMGGVKHVVTCGMPCAQLCTPPALLKQAYWLVTTCYCAGWRPPPSPTYPPRRMLGQPASCCGWRSMAEVDPPPAPYRMRWEALRQVREGCKGGGAAVASRCVYASCNYTARRYDTAGRKASRWCVCAGGYSAASTHVLF